LRSKIQYDNLKGIEEIEKEVKVAFPIVQPQIIGSVQSSSSPLKERMFKQKSNINQKEVIRFPIIESAVLKSA
jgi:Na+-transporting methylmalonyl-CoA/oxaloacetate decarboxylase beta subunit